MIQVTNDSDVALIHAIASGDRQALSALYERYASLMLSTAQRILRNRGEAEEILHDVFLEVWKKAGDYDTSRGQVRTWLLIRIRSRALDRCKSAGRSRGVPLDEARMAERAARGEDPSNSLDKARVRDAVSALPKKQQAVVRLAYFKGLSSSEIADELSIPIGTVKSRAAAGLASLRRGLIESPGGVG